MMHGAHIGGQRAGAFLELVDGVDPRRVLLVGVDVAKATWFVVASNLVGEVVVDGVRLVADRAGLAVLERLIAATSGQLDAAVVVVGVEAAGHHHQTLVGHLGDREGLVVRLLNPAQVAAVRKQQGNRRRKTDWLDAAAICELLARGEGSPHTWTPRRRPPCARCGAAARTWSMPAVGCGSRPGRWSTACGRGSRPPTSMLGSPRYSPAPSTPRPAGWWWGC